MHEINLQDSIFNTNLKLGETFDGGYILQMNIVQAVRAYHSVRYAFVENSKHSPCHLASAYECRHARTYAQMHARTYQCTHAQMHTRMNVPTRTHS